MTIRSTVELSRDLARNANWPLFRGGASDEQSVCAVTANWRSDHSDPQLMERHVAPGVAHKIVALKSALNPQLVLYFVHKTLQPKSRIVLHRKIWKSLPYFSETRRNLVAASQKLHDEIAFDCGNRVRFSSLAEVRDEDIVQLLLDLPNFDLTVPILLPRDIRADSALAAELTKSVFPPDGCAEYSDSDWAILASITSKMGGVCVRISPIDLEGIAVDFFAADDIGEQLEAVVLAHDGLVLFRKNT